MEHETQIETYKSIVVPESVVLNRGWNKYGSVPGLDDEELAAPWELERNIMLEEWGPVLALPGRSKENSIQPVIDEDGGVDWGAFGTVDFDRRKPKFDNEQYRADRLREERKGVLIALSVVAYRVPGQAKWSVLNLVHNGVIGLDDIRDEGVREMVRLYLRAERLRKEAAELEEKRQERKRRAAERMFGPLEWA